MFSDGSERNTAQTRKGGPEAARSRRGKGWGGGWMSSRAGERRGVSKRELAFLFPFLAPFFRIRLGNTNGHHLEIVPPSLHRVPTTHGLARLVPVVGGRGGGGSSYSLPGSLTRPPPHPSLSLSSSKRVFRLRFLRGCDLILEKTSWAMMVYQVDVNRGWTPIIIYDYIAEKFDAR